MSRFLVLTMILVLSVSTASAAVIGTWTSEALTGVDAGLYRHTLNLSTLENYGGAEILSFDISLSNRPMNQTGDIFSPAIDNDSHFLLQLSHDAGGPVTDVITVGAYEDGTNLAAAGTRAFGGIYENGFGNSFDLLQIVTPVDNPQKFSVLNGDYQVPAGAFVEGFGTVPIYIPEPTSLCLLGIGLLMVLIRRR